MAEVLVEYDTEVAYFSFIMDNEGLGSMAG